MAKSSLPPCNELDPLDVSMDDLEGDNLLRDFVLKQEYNGATDTPSSTHNGGYTSEESDYSATTPPQRPQTDPDIALFQLTDTNELVETVADYVADQDLTQIPASEKNGFTGKVIKGKTSKYRGVTQTSKSSWGAKYSAKRITNKCKTADEAAHAYDDYVKTHFPEKYPKFANFCDHCGKFTNPLELPQYANECTCSGVNPTSAESTSDSRSSSSSPMAETADNDDKLMRQGSASSLNSLKLSFTELNDALFDGSFEDLAKEAVDASDDFKMEQNPKRRKSSVDSASMAEISAVAEFAKGKDIDNIINDIHRSSSNSLSKHPSFRRFNSGSSKNMLASSTMDSSTFDLNPDEMEDLQDINTYLNDPAEDYALSVGSAPEPQEQQNGKYQGFGKMHSLDYEDSTVEGESTSVVGMSEGSRQESLPAQVDFKTSFLQKYWRNDRKNIQCFPYCREFGDYYRVQMEKLAHQNKGVCRADVDVRIDISSGSVLSPSTLVFLARCNSVFSREKALSHEMQLSHDEMDGLKKVSTTGIIESSAPIPSAGANTMQFDVKFAPDVWKFEFDLPKKRRHTQAGSEDGDQLHAEFLYFFEVDVFYSDDKETYVRLGHRESSKFQIANTRTLQRQRTKMGESAADRSAPNAMDHPDKQIVKAPRYQHANDSLLSRDDSMTEVADSETVKTADKTPPPELLSQSTSTHLDRWVSAVDDDAVHGDYGGYSTPRKQSTKATDGISSSGVPNVTTHEKAEAAPVHPTDAEKNTSDEAYSLPKLASYTLLCLPLSVVYLVCGLGMLLGFVLVPPMAHAIVRGLDTLSDMELSRANSSLIASDARYVLNRLATEPPTNERRVFRYHTSGEVWARLGFFTGGKLLSSVLSFFPTMLLGLCAVLVFPLRSLSSSISSKACDTALWTREYSRRQVGKPRASSPRPSSAALV